MVRKEKSKLSLQLVHAQIEGKTRTQMAMIYYPLIVPKKDIQRVLWYSKETQGKVQRTAKCHKQRERAKRAMQGTPCIRLSIHNEITKESEMQKLMNAKSLP